MDATRISEQERLENRDPSEAAMPIPFAIYGLVACLVVFGILYILADPQPLPGSFGDQRTLADLGPRPQGAAVADGATLYAARCAACHQPNGGGVPGAFPPLGGSEWVTGKPDVVVKILLQGISGALTVNGVGYTGAMPAFREQLDDAEIAAVASYVRSQWGNAAGAVDAAMVTGARAASAERTTPWNGDAELAALK